MLLAMLPVAGLGAQPSMVVTDARTMVASLTLAVVGDALDEGKLRERMATAPRPGGLRRHLGWLPLVDGPEAPRFDPVELQRDIVRLRHYCERRGFPQARVDYRVTPVADGHAVDIVIDIDPGPPMSLSGIRVEGLPEGASSHLQAAALRSRLPHRVRRPDEEELRRLEAHATAWLADEGHPFATVAADVEVSAAGTVAVLRIEPGRLAVIDSIEVSGVRQLTRRTVVERLVVAVGDTARPAALSESAELLQGLEIVQVVLVDLVPSAATAGATLRVRIVEGTPRLVTGRVGYADESGALGEVRWQHRNFLGGARTLQTSFAAETGIGALRSYPPTRRGVVLSVEQPGILSPRSAGIVRLLADHRDELREEVRSVGSDVTLILRRSSLTYVSLGLGGSYSELVQWRASQLGSMGFLTVLRVLDELEDRRFQSTVTLTGSWGVSDDLLRTTRGWRILGSAQLAGLDPWSTSQYLRANLSGSWLRRLRDDGTRILLRGRAGRIVAMGRSSADGDALLSYLHLGDVVFTEGGTRQTRGWERDLAGPFVPDLRFVTDSDGAIRFVARDRYVPLGGLARWGLSLELQRPFTRQDGPYLLAFADAARVWTPDEGFLDEEDGLPLLRANDKARIGVGGGVEWPTPVGLLRLMVGYKLNPTRFELMDPGDVGRAVIESTPEEELRKHGARRWRLHVGLGQAF